jgi:hypothetical protein
MKTDDIVDYVHRLRSGGIAQTIRELREYVMWTPYITPAQQQDYCIELTILELELSRVPENINEIKDMMNAIIARVEKHLLDRHHIEEPLLERMERARKLTQGWRRYMA